MMALSPPRFGQPATPTRRQQGPSDTGNEGNAHTMAQTQTIAAPVAYATIEDAKAAFVAGKLDVDAYTAEVTRLNAVPARKADTITFECTYVAPGTAGKTGFVTQNPKLEASITVGTRKPRTIREDVIVWATLISPEFVEAMQACAAEAGHAL